MILTEDDKRITIDNPQSELIEEAEGYLSRIKKKLRINSLNYSLNIQSNIFLLIIWCFNLVHKDKWTLLAQLVPDACHFQIQGKDHLTVTSDPKFHMVVKAFLNYINRNQ